MLNNYQIKKKDGTDFSALVTKEALAIRYLDLDNRESDTADFKTNPVLDAPEAFLGTYGNKKNIEIEFRFVVTAEGGASQYKDAKLTINICGSETLSQAEEGTFAKNGDDGLEIDVNTSPRPEYKYTAAELFTSSDDYCKALTVVVASDSDITTPLTGYKAQNVFMRSESNVEKLVKIPKNETEVNTEGVITNPGWTYYVKSCTIGGVCLTLEAVMQTKCTVKSNKIFLVYDTVIARRFLKNEDDRTALSESDVVGSFRAFDDVTCPIIRYDIKNGDPDFTTWS